MAGVYSTRFMYGSLGSGDSQSYTPPAGDVAIVTDWLAYSGAGAPDAYLAALQFPESFIVDTAVVAELGANGTYHFRGRLVVGLGESITVEAFQACNFYVGGYLLQG